jgi:aminomethyltransferase
MDDNLKRTPLYEAHVAAGAKMVPFAGYEMPVQYAAGVMAEHQWTRQRAGLFDVSHMGQCFIKGTDHETVATALEQLVPADIRALQPARQRYSQLLAEDGGILDDLMITRWAEDGGDGLLYVVVNAGCKAQDYAHFRHHLPATIKLDVRDDLALLALQGPQSAAVLDRLLPGVAGLAFMQSGSFSSGSARLHVSRSGYTGEDGFEISLPESEAAKFWQQLLGDENVKPIGIGARDSLRLEAGLCLYGHDIDATTSPVEAGLQWSIQKSRRQGGNFPGAARILKELADGPARKRVGIQPEGRAIAREGTVILNADGKETGRITSGGFGPTVNGPVAMGYVSAAHAEPGTPLQLAVRDKLIAATVVPLPFVPNNFKR